MTVEHAKPVPASVWHGWGDPAERKPLPGHALRFLDDALGAATAPGLPVRLEQVLLNDSALPDAAASALVAVVGPENVHTDRESRIVHAGGKSYVDLLRRRRGDAGHAPDAVVYPGDHEQVQQLLAVCVEREVAVVPFGGGTSVVGGVEPVRGRFTALIALDLQRLDALLDVDPVSMTASLQARPADRSSAGRARTHPRALPAELGAGQPRRVHRHSLGGAGLHRLRTHRRAGARRHLRHPPR
jgi:alkyldihydroxyacetonephosphate synthase